MTDLTDRMRTCAAFIMSRPHDAPMPTEHLLDDAAALLIEASNLLEVVPVAIETIEKLTEQPRDQRHDLHPPVPDGIPPLDTQGTWIAPGGPLPTALRVSMNPRACPKCDSRAWKKVTHQGKQVMLTCGVCGTQWEWRAS